MVSVRKIESGDHETWLRLRRELWPEGSEAEHRDEITHYFSSESAHLPTTALLAEDGTGRVVGIVELSIRSHAEGCESNQVAYLEGWYVVPDVRGKGVGRALVEAAENWGRSNGCSEFASDAHLDNTVSNAAHLALGFTEVDVIRCYRKNL